MTVDLFYKEHGTGIPLTLLHGYPLNHTIWANLIPQVSTVSRMILPDLRGHGQSPKPQGPYSMQEMAEDVVRLWDRLGIEKSILGGHSMGGYVSLAVARHFPDRLAGLALIASRTNTDAPEKRKNRLASIETVREQGAASVVSSMPEKLSYNSKVQDECREIIARASDVGVMGVLAAMANRSDSLDLFSNLDIPALIIAGAEDQIVPIADTRKVAKKMKKPWFVEIAGAGHMPMFDKPEEVIKALIAFIQFIKENH
jgi:3-oxoadipate enol-lactonase